jgi:prepilin-type N-terminal cleavage/methylation domain-containing protein
MRGFTLVELVLVVALLGILSLYTIPRLVPSNAGLDAAARKIQSDIVYAQSLAMSRGVPHGVNFTAGGAYVVYQTSPATPIVDPLTRSPFSENLSRYGRSRVTAAYRVEFNTLGRPTLGGGGGVTIENGGTVRSVQITAETGRAEIP